MMPEISQIKTFVRISKLNFASVSLEKILTISKSVELSGIYLGSIKVKAILVLDNLGLDGLAHLVGKNLTGLYAHFE